MKISIHQPMYIPWIGYFNKIMLSEKFVILDDAEFSKNDWFNRNKIKAANGDIWLTVPVKYKDNSSSLIKDITIDDKQNWRRKHLNSIKQNYSKADFYKEFNEFLEDIYSKDWKFLIDLNMEIIRFIINKLKTKTEIIFASELNINDKSTERLVKICKVVGADTYLSGLGAKEYLNSDLFKLNNLNLEFQNFHHPEYQQLHGPFISHMSVLDLLLNCGAEQSKKIILTD